MKTNYSRTIQTTAYSHAVAPDQTRRQELVTGRFFSWSEAEAYERAEHRLHTLCEQARLGGPAKDLLDEIADQELVLGEIDDRAAARLIRLYLLG